MSVMEERQYSGKIKKKKHTPKEKEGWGLSLCKLFDDMEGSGFLAAAGLCAASAGVEWCVQKSS